MRLDRDAVEKIQAEFSELGEGLPPPLQDGPGAVSSLYTSLSIADVRALCDLALEALSAREATEGGEAVAWPGGDGALYEKVHNIAIAAYEATTPVDYRYSAAALRRAVDASINDALRSASIPPSGVAEARAEALEEAARECEAQAKQFLSPEYASNQPIGSITERFACDECAAAIRNLIPSKEAE